MGPDSTDMISEVSGQWEACAGNWMVGGKTMYLVSEKIDSARLTLPCDVRAQVRLGDR